MAARRVGLSVPVATMVQAAGVVVLVQDLGMIIDVSSGLTQAYSHVQLRVLTATNSKCTNQEICRASSRFKH